MTRLALALNPLAVTYTDDFNRANSTTIGGSWVEDSGNWAINTNAVRQETGGGSYRKLRYNAAMDTNNYYIQADLTVRNEQSPAVFGRGATSGTVTYYAYLFFVSDSSYGVEITAGAETIGATGGSTGASGTTYAAARLTCNGTALSGTRNGVSDLSWSDATLTSGHTGLATYGGNSIESACADNWSAADLAVAATSLPPVSSRTPFAILAR